MALTVNGRNPEIDKMLEVLDIFGHRAAITVKEPVL
jgi:hypothetical protein